MNAPELGAVRWHKSTRSGANGNCVECADLGSLVAVRDSKDPDGPVLTFNRDVWRAFVEGIKNDDRT